MALWQFNGRVATTYSSLGFTAEPGAIYDLSPNFAAPDSNWSPTGSSAVNLPAQPTLGLRTSRIALLGDSITSNGGDYTTANAAYTSANGYWGWAKTLLNNSFDLAFRDATHPFWAQVGYKTSDIISNNWHVQVAASSASVVVVNIGTNDITNATPQQIVANLQAIWSTLLAAGKIVVATTILPRNAGDSAGVTAVLHQTNRLIRAAAVGVPGLYLCDWFGTCLDPSTGLLSTKYSSDGVHPNPAGASRLGAVLASVLSGLLPAGNPQFLSVADTDPRAVSPNAFALGNTAGLATNWHAYTLGTPTTITPSKVVRTDLTGGEWQQYVIAAANSQTDGVQLQVFGSTNYSVGDTVIAMAEFQTDATSWDCRGLYLNLACAAAASSGTELNFSASDRTSSTTAIYRPPAGVLVTPPTTVLSGTTNVQANLFFYGSGTIRVSRMQVLKIN